MPSPTSPIKASCLLFVVVAVMVGAASAADKPVVPGSCLVAASTLCANADTSAMRCLRTLAIKRDARVPAACAEALITAGMANVKNPRRNLASRASRLSRLLTEGGACTGTNTCPNSDARTNTNTHPWMQ